MIVPPVEPSHFRRRVLIIGAALLIAAIAVLLAAQKSPEAPVYGEPERGKSLAFVHAGAKTGYFPGVVCESSDPEILTVSLGVHDDPISFFLAAWVGPTAPATLLVIGHRPGVAFDQNGSGTMTVSSELQNQLHA